MSLLVQNIFSCITVPLNVFLLSKFHNQSFVLKQKMGIPQWFCHLNHILKLKHLCEGIWTFVLICCLFLYGLVTWDISYFIIFVCVCMCVFYPLPSVLLIFF